MSALNRDQGRALELVLSGHNVLVTGSAGTGKSFLLGQIVRECEKIGKTVALTSTTGIACSVYTSMSLNAKTLHRWAGIEDGRYSVSEIRKVPVKKVKFTVFSVRENRDIAVRDQLPLKLAFAISIHKAQGMTLDKVEVDCRGIFKPGQLGVAMSRARDSGGLRVTNFTPRACMPRPDIVKEFISIPSKNFSEDQDLL